MNELLKWITKYWIVLSVVFTIMSSRLLEDVIKSRTDKDEDVLGDQSMRSDHDDDLRSTA